MKEKIYLVGGAVRDELLGQKSKDLDFVVQCASFERLKEIVVEKGGEIFLENPEFLTVRAKVPGLASGADFVLPRADGAYRDGRHPESVEPGSLLQDLERRDFTINAIAKDVETGELIDPFHGQDDIKKGVIRCVSDPIARFAEDELRIFRAIRFAVTKGFRIDIHTETAILKGGFSFENVSAERIREELLKCCKINSLRTMTFLRVFNLELVVHRKGIWFKPTLEQ